MLVLKKESKKLDSSSATERPTGLQDIKSLTKDKDLGPFKIIDLQINQKLPSILAKNPENNRPTLFLLDSGSEINIIKLEVLPPTTRINTDVRIALKGISPTPVKTIGVMQMRIFNHFIDVMELDDLRNFINFPMERPAILNGIARKVTGNTAVQQGTSFLRLLDEDSLEKLANSTWKKLWQKFLTFGTASAGIIAIIMLVQLFKILVDTIIRGYTLYSLYGWSMRIFGAILGSSTSLLVYLGHSAADRESTANQGVEMNRINYQPIPQDPNDNQNQQPKQPIQTIYPQMKDPNAPNYISYQPPSNFPSM